MKNIMLAVLLSAFVWPGAGQVYNKELRKGFVLFGLTFLMVISFMLGAMSQLGGMTEFGKSGVLDFSAARKLTETVARLNPGLVRTFNLLMSLTWVYSVVDAGFSAKERLTGTKQEKKTE